MWSSLSEQTHLLNPSFYSLVCELFLKQKLLQLLLVNWLLFEVLLWYLYDLWVSEQSPGNQVVEIVRNWMSAAELIMRHQVAYYPLNVLVIFNEF